MTDITTDDLDLRQRIVEIDRAIAQMHQALADHDRKRQEIKLAPWLIAISIGTMLAAFFGAGVVLTKLLSNLPN